MKMVLIKEIKGEQINNALSLVWKVFNEFESPDYSQEGVDEFYKTLKNKSYLSTLRIFGAFENDKLLGVIATRKEGTHIALFFVDGKYHRQGIGRQLFETVLKYNHSGNMTVNSSPYAVDVYHRFGFYDTDYEQVVSGLRFVPMELKF